MLIFLFDTYLGWFTDLSLNPTPNLGQKILDVEVMGRQGIYILFFIYKSQRTNFVRSEIKFNSAKTLHVISVQILITAKIPLTQLKFINKILIK